jgi:hypothetical protein
MVVLGFDAMSAIVADVIGRDAAREKDRNASVDEVLPVSRLERCWFDLIRSAFLRGDVAFLYRRL